VRRRLVESTLVVALLAVVLLGLPLAVAGAIVQRDAALEDVQARALNLERAVLNQIESGEPVTDSLLARLPESYYGEIQLASGLELSTGPPPDGQFITGEVVSDDLVVRVERPRGEVDTSMRRAILLVLTLATVAVLASVGYGLLQARRLSAPLVDLARRAQQMGSGGTATHFVRYGLDEVDRVADVLERSSARLSSMLASERQFASDASHQLRTPLTALSMRLEEIMYSEDPAEVREEARIALTQVERLSGVVDDLLDSARESRSLTAVPLEVDEILRQQVQEWRPIFAGTGDGRVIVLKGEKGVRALATPGGVSQVLSTLLENSLVHGAGDVTVGVRRTATWAVVEITDEGPGVPAHLGSSVFERSVSAASSTGLGLGLARDLAESDGGRLELLRLRPPVFAVFLREPNLSQPNLSQPNLSEPDGEL
jgi:signal transduction histidine kinase